MSDDTKAKAKVAREIVLWVLVILCQLGYPVGPLLAGAGVPLPIGSAHSAVPVEHSP